jgi:hypothetical protein
MPLDPVVNAIVAGLTLWLLAALVAARGIYRRWPRKLKPEPNTILHVKGRRECPAGYQRVKDAFTLPDGSKEDAYVRPGGRISVDYVRPGEEVTVSIMRVRGVDIVLAGSR